MKIAFTLLFFCLAALADEPTAGSQQALKFLFPKAPKAVLDNLAKHSAEKKEQDFARELAALYTDLNYGLNHVQVEHLTSDVRKLRDAEARRAPKDQDPTLLGLLDRITWANKLIDGEAAPAQSNEEFRRNFTRTFQDIQNKNRREYGLAESTVKERKNVEIDADTVARQLRANHAYFRLAGMVRELKDKWQDGAMSRDEMKRKIAELEGMLQALEKEMAELSCLPSAAARERAEKGDH